MLIKEVEIFPFYFSVGMENWVGNGTGKAPQNFSLDTSLPSPGGAGEGCGEGGDQRQLSGLSFSSSLDPSD